MVVPAPIEALVNQLNDVTIRQAPPVQLRRRSFGRQQKIVVEPSATPNLATIPVEEVTSPTVSEDVTVEREAAQSPPIRVPELNFEAPSPELRILEEEEEIADDWGLEDPIVEEEVPEPIEEAISAVDLVEESTESYSPSTQSYPLSTESYGNHYSEQYSPVAASIPTEYGFDDSQVFGADDSQVLSNSTSVGSGFGEWTGNSETQQGYDYAAPSQSQLEPAYDSYSQSTPNVEAYQNQYAAPSAPPPSNPGIYESSDRNGNYSKPPTLYSSNNPTTVYSSPPKRQPQSLRSVSNDPYVPETSHRPPPLRSASATSYIGFPSTQQQPVTSPPVHQQQNSFDPYANNSRAPLSPMDPPSSWRGPDRAASADPYASTYDPYAVASRPPLDRRISSNSGIGSLIPDLGLDRSTAPLVTFGFGGKMLVVFPNAVRSNYGMDSNLYGTGSTVDLDSTPSTVHIRQLVDYVPASESTTFPGPIFMDGGKANAGKKRKEAVSWLDQRISEQEQETSYVTRSQHSKSLEKNVDNRLILLKLVKLLVENEGKLTGT